MVYIIIILKLYLYNFGVTKLTPVMKNEKNNNMTNINDKHCELKFLKKKITNSIS